MVSIDFLAKIIRQNASTMRVHELILTKSLISIFHFEIQMFEDGYESAPKSVCDLLWWSKETNRFTPLHTCQLGGNWYFSMSLLCKKSIRLDQR